MKTLRYRQEKMRGRPRAPAEGPDRSTAVLAQHIPTTRDQKPRSIVRPAQGLLHIRGLEVGVAPEYTGQQSARNAAERQPTRPLQCSTNPRTGAPRCSLGHAAARPMLRILLPVEERSESPPE